MTEKLWKTFPTITEGLKEILETSYSLRESVGNIGPDFRNDEDNRIEDDQFNELVMSHFISNSVEYWECQGLMSCCMKVSPKGGLYFEYTTNGNLGFSFRRFRNGKALFMIWKTQPKRWFSGKFTLTRDFQKAGWRKNWRWALILWGLETWQAIREPRTYAPINSYHSLKWKLKAKWLKMRGIEPPKQAFDEDVPF